MISALDEDRRQMIDRYAADQMTGNEYIAANRALDQKLERLVREKARLAAALRSAQHEDFVDASVRQFCATAKARFRACTDFDENRQFLVDHVERVIFDHYKVTVVGSVPVQTASETTKLPFRIDGTIDIAAKRSEIFTESCEGSHAINRGGARRAGRYRSIHASGRIGRMQSSRTGS